MPSVFCQLDLNRISSINSLSRGNLACRQTGLCFLFTSLSKIVSFSFLLLIFFLISSSKVEAVPTCDISTLYIDTGSTFDLIGTDKTGLVALINRNVAILGSLKKTPTDVILSRYVYYGYGSWQEVSPKPDSSDTYDWFEAKTQYSQAKDYLVGAGWVYRNAAGTTKTVICSQCLRVMEKREVKSYGTRRLTYPSATSATQTVKGSKSYTGLVYVPLRDNFSGNNNGYTPSPNYNSDGSMNAWWWSSQWDSRWAGNYLKPNAFDGISPFVVIGYPKILPPQISFNLTAPTFKAGEGSGAYCDYGFNNLVIYSRDLRENPGGGCGSLPPITSSLSCSGGCYSSSANCQKNCGQSCTRLDQTNAAQQGCWLGAYRCCQTITSVTPTPTPPVGQLPTPVPKTKCSKVTGYVKDSVTKKGVAGAKVTAHGIDNSVGNCLGKHYDCSTAATNSNGYFEISCANVSDANTKCLGVYETQNASGYTDAYGAYGPAGVSIWSNNTIMYNNPQVNTCGPFYFFDKK